ncbi:MAG TPA: FliM/FliN family flagellar motor switch protein [Solirubrobacteraceae bacterium]|jgi:flagellar motor switch protein FliN|nr:FliM/FliN family flagellar motor switch protein [Solirubrobacteraceae bacterium]
MSDDAIIRLGRSTSQAISGVLETLAPGQVEPRDVTVVGSPFDSVPAPGVAISVSYVEAVTGGHVFVMTLEGARRLAAAARGGEAQDSGAPELSEAELSVLTDAVGQMMASAAIATSSVIGTEVEVGEPATRTFTAASDARDVYPKTPHAVRAAFTVCGEPCSLVQLIPSAFVVRMTRALDELDAEVAPSTPSLDAFHVPAGPSLAGIPVRVWAELGRAQMPSAQVVGLPAGAVVELDRSADEPIDLYVNGRRFATGRLVVVDGADWAVRIDEVLHAGDGLADA